MYFILKNDLSFESDSVIRLGCDLPQDVSFMSGELISSPIDEPIVFTTNAKKGDVLRDFLRSDVTLMSSKFLKLLEAVGVDNLQAYSAVVRSEVDGTEWCDYVVVNVVGVIACADLARSTYDQIMPGHYIFDELAIFPEKADGALMFRLAEHLPTVIIHRSVGRFIKDSDPDRELVGWAVGKIIQ